MEQLICHLLGDYILQPDEMARKKTASWTWAILHGFWYTVPFAIFFWTHWVALIAIAASHALIDRYRLARYVVMFKNAVVDGFTPYLTQTGYPDSMPPVFAMGLLIAADNTIHLLINYVCLRLW